MATEGGDGEGGQGRGGRMEHGAGTDPAAQARETAALLADVSNVSDLVDLAQSTRALEESLAASNDRLRDEELRALQEAEAGQKGGGGQATLERLVDTANYRALPQEARNNLYSARYYLEGLRRIKEKLLYLMQDFGVRFVCDTDEPVVELRASASGVAAPPEYVRPERPLLNGGHFVWSAEMASWVSCFYIIFPGYEHAPSAAVAKERNVRTLDDAWVTSARRMFEHVGIRRNTEALPGVDPTGLTYSVIVRWAFCRPESRLPNTDVSSIKFADKPMPSAREILDNRASAEDAGAALAESMDAHLARKRRRTSAEAAAEETAPSAKRQRHEQRKAEKLRKKKEEKRRSAAAKRRKDRVAPEGQQRKKEKGGVEKQQGAGGHQQRGAKKKQRQVAAKQRPQKSDEQSGHRGAGSGAPAIREAGRRSRQIIQVLMVALEQGEARAGWRQTEFRELLKEWCDEYGTDWPAERAALVRGLVDKLSAGAHAGDESRLVGNLLPLLEVSSAAAAEAGPAGDVGVERLYAGDVELPKRIWRQIRARGHTGTESPPAGAATLRTVILGRPRRAAALDFLAIKWTPATGGEVQTRYVPTVEREGPTLDKLLPFLCGADASQQGADPKIICVTALMLLHSLFARRQKQAKT